MASKHVSDLQKFGQFSGGKSCMGHKNFGHVAVEQKLF